MTALPPSRWTEWRTSVVFAVAFLTGYGVTVGAFFWAGRDSATCGDQNAVGLVATIALYGSAGVALVATIRRLRVWGLWLAAFLLTAAGALLLTLLVLISQGIGCPDIQLERTQNALEQELRLLVDDQSLGLTSTDGVETSCPSVLNVMCDSVVSTVKFDAVGNGSEACESLWRLQQQAHGEITFGEVETSTRTGNDLFRASASTARDPRILAACKRIVAKGRVFGAVVPIDVSGVTGTAFSRATVGGPETAWEGRILVTYSDYGEL